MCQNEMCALHAWAQSSYMRIFVCVCSVCACFMCRTIKVWDLKAALDPRTPVQNLCLRTLVVSGGGGVGEGESDSDKYMCVMVWMSQWTDRNTGHRALLVYVHLLFSLSGNWRSTSPVMMYAGFWLIALGRLLLGREDEHAERATAIQK